MDTDRILRTRRLRELTLAGPTPHLSAASGLVRFGQRLYVVADDERGLGVFDVSGAAPGRLLEWSDQPLPSAHAARKAAKPDLEALTWMPPHTACPHGALLALGSGSRPTRERAFVLPLDAAGQAATPEREVDLAPLYDGLRGHLGELNIEGVFFSCGDLVLLQRGGSARSNTSLRFDAGASIAWLAGQGPLPVLTARTDFDLGHLDGVPLAFTDGAALGSDGSWLYSAAAEDTTDSYNDGACLGSVIGIVDRAGRMHLQRRLDAVCKVEGVAVVTGETPWELLLVTDADDRRQPARLLGCSLQPD